MCRERPGITSREGFRMPGERCPGPWPRPTCHPDLAGFQVVHSSDVCKPQLLLTRRKGPGHRKVVLPVMGGALLAANPGRSEWSETVTLELTRARAGPGLCPLNAPGAGPACPFFPPLPSRTEKEFDADSLWDSWDPEATARLPVFSFVIEEAKGPPKSIPCSKSPSQQRTVPAVLPVPGHPDT